MTDWTPFTSSDVRERLAGLGISVDATDEQIGEVIEEVIEESRTEPLPTLPPALQGKPCRCLDPNCEVPYGICHCGCGGKTAPYISTDTKFGRIKGQYALCLPRHTMKHGGGGGFAMPFLTAARQKVSGTSKRRKTRTLGLATGEHAAMFEALGTQCDKNRRVKLSAWTAMNLAGLENFSAPSAYAASRIFRELVEMGCIISHGPKIKELMRHPDGTLFTPPSDAPDVVKWKYERTGKFAKATPAQPATKEQSLPAPAPAPTHVDMLAAVSTKEMADALANAMWTRYEWALTELGAAREALAAKDDEIARLRSLLDGIEPDATEVARRILTDAPH